MVLRGYEDGDGLGSGVGVRVVSFFGLEAAELVEGVVVVAHRGEIRAGSFPGILPPGLVCPELITGSKPLRLY